MSTTLGFVLASTPVVVASLLSIVLAVACRRQLADHEQRGKFSMAIVLAALVVAIPWIAVQKATAPGPVSEQITKLLSEARADGGHVVYRWQGQLHGADRSLVLVSSPSAYHDMGRSDLQQPDSDKIAIYDEEEGRMKLRFSFWPQSAGTVTQQPEGDSPGLRFRVRSVGDIQGNGSTVVIGAFERLTLATVPLPVPVAIGWSEAESEYAITPLLDEPPDVRAVNDFDAATLAAYTSPTQIIDRRTRARADGYATFAYDVWRGETGPIMGATFMNERVPEKLELSAWRVDGEEIPVRAFPCFPNDQKHEYVPGDIGLAYKPIRRLVEERAAGQC